MGAVSRAGSCSPACSASVTTGPINGISSCASVGSRASVELLLIVVGSRASISGIFGRSDEGAAKSAAATLCDSVDAASRGVLCVSSMDAGIARAVSTAFSRGSVRVGDDTFDVCGLNVGSAGELLPQPAAVPRGGVLIHRQTTFMEQSRTCAELCHQEKSNSLPKKFRICRRV